MTLALESRAASTCGRRQTAGGEHAQRQCGARLALRVRPPTDSTPVHEFNLERTTTKLATRAVALTRAELLIVIVYQAKVTIFSMIF